MFYNGWFDGLSGMVCLGMCVYVFACVRLLTLCVFVCVYLCEPTVCPHLHVGVGCGVSHTVSLTALLVSPPLLPQGVAGKFSSVTVLFWASEPLGGPVTSLHSVLVGPTMTPPKPQPPPTTFGLPDNHPVFFHSLNGSRYKGQPLVHARPKSVRLFLFIFLFIYFFICPFLFACVEFIMCCVVFLW